MSEAQFAQRSGIPLEELRALRLRREGPRFRISGRGDVRYSPDALDWAERHRSATGAADPHS